MKEVFAKVKKDPLLQYPGKLGQLIGPFERGYLVGIMGPYKRGKTWHLMEIAVLGILNNLNVLFISLEMGKEQVSQRLYKRLTSFGETPGEYRYPCFDCHKNQVGTCQLPERASSNDLYTMGSEPPEFEDVTFEYTPCTYCRKHHLQEYEPATWYVTDERNGFSFDTVSKNVSTVPNKLRVMCYAAYSATLNDLKRDIELLEYTEGFIPDIIVTDYADIFAPDDSRLLGRELLDSIWKIHKQIAASLNCLVVTGSQTNKKSADAKNVNSTDVAEDYRKLAHVDKMIMISQTSVEKDRGVQRLSCINRHEESNEHKQVLVLNNFNLGQVVLDSEYRKKKKST